MAAQQSSIVGLSPDPSVLEFWLTLADIEGVLRALSLKKVDLPPPGYGWITASSGHLLVKLPALAGRFSLVIWIR